MHNPSLAPPVQAHAKARPVVYRALAQLWLVAFNLVMAIFWGFISLLVTNNHRINEATMIWDIRLTIGVMVCFVLMGLLGLLFYARGYLLDFGDRLVVRGAFWKKSTEASTWVSLELGSNGPVLTEDTGRKFKIPTYDAVLIDRICRQIGENRLRSGSG